MDAAVAWLGTDIRGSSGVPQEVFYFSVLQVHPNQRKKSGTMAGGNNFDDFEFNSVASSEQLSDVSDIEEQKMPPKRTSRGPTTSKKKAAAATAGSSSAGRIVKSGDDVDLEDGTETTKLGKPTLDISAVGPPGKDCSRKGQ